MFKTQEEYDSNHADIVAISTDYKSGMISPKEAFIKLRALNYGHIMAVKHIETWRTDKDTKIVIEPFTSDDVRKF